MKIFLILLLSTLLFGSHYDDIKEAVDQNNMKRAISLARLDAVSGNLNAMYNLSILYLAQNDVNKAKTWLNKCSQEQYKRANFVLGLLVLEEKRSKQSLREARQYFEGSIQTAEVQSFIKVIDDYLSKSSMASSQDFLSVASWYYKDKTFHNNYMLAIRILTTAADRGCVECRSEIGNIYLRKRPTRTFYSDALYAVDQALEKNDNQAKRIAGEIYVHGPLMLRNLDLGKKYLLDAYNSGDKFAGALLAKVELSSTKQSSYPEAIQRLRDSSTACYSNAVYAYAYKNGRGVVRDSNKAKYYENNYEKCQTKKLKENLPLVIY